MRRETEYREMSGPAFLRPLLLSFSVLSFDPGVPLQNIRVHYGVFFPPPQDSDCSALR